MDQYVEGNYYEFFGDKHAEYLVLRFIKSEERNNLIYDLTNKIELKFFVEKTFYNLPIIVCRILETKSKPTERKKMIFEDFFEYIRVKYKKSLQLQYIPEDQKYSLSLRFFSEEEKFDVSDNINDFFKKLDKKFQIKLTTEEKDDFISKQFAE